MIDYILTIQTTQCKYQIFVNGFPVFKDWVGHTTDLKIPINQYIKNGENTINVLLSSLDEQPLQTTASHKLVVVKAEEILLSLKTPEFSEDTFLNNIKIVGAFHIYRTENDFVFFNSPIFQKGNETAQKIKDFYLYMWEIMEKRDIDMLMALTLQRDMELANAYNITLKERIEDIRPFFKKVLTHSSLRLINLDFRKYKLIFYCNDRVVCFEDEKGEQPIVFKDKATGMKVALPFYVCNNPNKELLIIR